jgi:hypothetical protein
MNINFQIRYSLNKNDSTLCFRHAVHAALAGNDIKTEVEDFENIAHTTCHLCMSDAFNEIFKEPEPHYYSDDNEEEDDDGNKEEPRNYIKEAVIELTDKQRDLKIKGFHIRKKKNGI